MSNLVQNYFDRKATVFDSIYLNENFFLKWFNLLFRKAIYERFQIAINESRDIQGKTILDIGCGGGRYAVQYAKLGAKKVTGIDLSANMIELSKQLAQQEEVADKCNFIKTNFLDFDTSEKFDVIIAMGVFDYIDNPTQFLEKMIAVSNHKIIASFPGESFLRMYIRKLRYKYKKCPVFFYSEAKLNQIAEISGLDDYKLIYIAHSGTGYILVGNI